MSIISISTQGTGNYLDSQKPRRVPMLSTDNLATVTAAGYLTNKNTIGYNIDPTDIVAMTYSYSDATKTGTYEEFTVSIDSSGVITLIQFVSPGDVTLPVVNNDFANFDGTTGKIKDSGYLPTNAAKTKVVMADAVTVANHIMVSTDAAGTSGNKTGTAINDGDIQAGRSTIIGGFSSFPAGAALGSFKFQASNSAANYNNVFTNASTNQDTTFTVPDGGAATKVLGSGTTLVSGNLLMANGTVGLVQDSTIVASNVQLKSGIKAALTANIGGAGAGPIDVTVAGLTAASVINATVSSSSNAVSVLKVVGGTNKFTITFSADPGASAIVNYVAYIAAQ